MKTGKRIRRCEVSLIDTPLLLAGALAACVYFSEDTPDEKAIRERADAIYRRIDWQWARGGARTARQGSKPERGLRHADSLGPRERRSCSPRRPQISVAEKCDCRSV